VVYRDSMHSRDRGVVYRDSIHSRDRGVVYRDSVHSRDRGVCVGNVVRKGAVAHSVKSNVCYCFSTQPWALVYRKYV
jgi:hypothetical protein